MARERNEARLMEALMSQQPDPFAAILAWEDDRPFPRDFRLAAECSKRAGVLAMMAAMRCDEAMRTQAFAALLRAMVLSDSRIGAMGHTLQALRLPEAFFHVTEDFAFTGETCLCRLDPAVFLALACGVYISNNSTAPCARTGAASATSCWRTWTPAAWTCPSSTPRPRRTAAASRGPSRA